MLWTERFSGTSIRWISNHAPVLEELLGWSLVFNVCMCVCVCVCVCERHGMSYLISLFPSLKVCVWSRPYEQFPWIEIEIYFRPPNEATIMWVKLSHKSINFSDRGRNSVQQLNPRLSYTNISFFIYYISEHIFRAFFYIRNHKVERVYLTANDTGRR